MARLNADLSFFMLVSDYDPAHYNWTEKELSALGDCKATAEVIKKRLEDNGAKVKEMYAIEHKSEKKADSRSEKFHGATDEAKLHYHILARFEPSHGATLEKIAEYIGVPVKVIVDPKRGRYGYPNNLAYLTHIKYENKIQYAPEAVVTLAGTDYMDYYNANKEGWIKRGRAAVAEKGGKTLDRRFREAEMKLDSGELTYEELADTEEYCELLTNPKYGRKLLTKSNLVKKVCQIHLTNMKKVIADKKIATWEEITASKHFKLLQTYGYTQDLKSTLETAIKNSLQNDFINLQQDIIEHRITRPYEDIEACEQYRTVCKYYKEEIEEAIKAQAESEYHDLYYAILNREITRVEAKSSGRYTYAYLLFEDDIENESMPFHKGNRC